MEEVFYFVADERNEPRFNPRILSAAKISPGPIGVGTQVHAEMTTAGRVAQMTIEFTEYQRPRRLASSTHMPSMDIHGSLTFDAADEGTRMRWAWDLAPSGGLRLIGPLVALMGKRQEQAIWANLKRLLEVPSPARET